MRNLSRSLLALVAFLALAGWGLHAQVISALTPASVQQSRAMANAATGLYGPAGGATACSTVNTSVANNTVTITPPANKYVYVTSVNMDVTADTTGTTQVITISTTNLSGGPYWSGATIAPTAGAMGTFRQIAEAYPTALRSSAPGTAVTFVPSAASLTDTILCMRVAAYFGD